MVTSSPQPIYIFFWPSPPSLHPTNPFPLSFIYRLMEADKRRGFLPAACCCSCCYCVSKQLQKVKHEQLDSMKWTVLTGVHHTNILTIIVDWAFRINYLATAVKNKYIYKKINMLKCCNFFLKLKTNKNSKSSKNWQTQK